MIVIQWFEMMNIHVKYKPNHQMIMTNYVSLFMFEFAFIMFTFATDCIFVNAHGKLTVAFLGGLAVNLIVLAVILLQGAKDSFSRAIAKFVILFVVLAGGF